MYLIYIYTIGYHFICFDACEIGRLNIYIYIRIYICTLRGMMFSLCARVRVCTPIRSPPLRTPSASATFIRIRIYTRGGGRRVCT